jgi:acyl phosphate:glycerol-3-phosphate acyltransferase
MSGSGVAALVGFALGSIPFSWILARLVGGVDIRAVGSGNVGATNVARSLGWWAGGTALLLDAAKGAAAVLLAPHLAGDAAGASLWAGGAAILGHMFSPLLAFRGGKGVATGAGVFAVLSPAPTGIAIGLFAATVLITRMISAGSIVAAVALPAASLGLEAGRGVTLLAAGVGALVIVRHRSNLARILAGTESRLGGGRGGRP